MQWRIGKWRLELDTKSGPLETGDFGENRQRASDNGENRPGPWKLVILAKMVIVAKLAISSKIAQIAN